MHNREGRIIVPADVEPWPHEIATAKALAKVGYTVEFLPRTEGDRVKSADIAMDGVVWEMKAPKSSGSRHFERVLRRAMEQSRNVIVDAARTPNLRDITFERELRQAASNVSGLRRLILIRKDRTLVDIK